MISANNTREYKAGFIIFILEYINGLSSISVRTVFVNCNDHKKSLKKERCRHKFFLRTSWNIQSESYLYNSKQV
jgi:hypothetical protein